MKNLKLFKNYLYQVNILFILVLKIFVSCQRKQPNLIYILEWTTSEDWVYLNLGRGQEAFITRNCTFRNCFLTKDRSYFRNLLKFDVLLFNVLHMGSKISEPPRKRSQSQLYVLVGLEPAVYHRIPTKFNGIFNMTWSYKLTADIIYPYFLVRNKRGKLIGPRKNMHWDYDFEVMSPINNDTIFKLRYKNIAAAVVLSHANALSGRDEFITSLKEQLLKYRQQLDIYGNSEIATQNCLRIPGEKNGLITSCVPRIESDYYFYLAFENSISEDYVTEKVLHGLNHFAVPVVYGGANYTSYMPDGIYLNARTLGVKKLAKEMNDIIRNPQRYFNFFKWHGYYTFYDTYGMEYQDRYSVCNICAVLNKRVRSERRTTYKNITRWWNGFDTPIQSTTHSQLSTRTEGKKESTDFSKSSVISNLYDYLINTQNNLV